LRAAVINRLQAAAKLTELPKASEVSVKGAGGSNASS